MNNRRYRILGILCLLVFSLSACSSAPRPQSGSAAYDGDIVAPQSAPTPAPAAGAIEEIAIEEIAIEETGAAVQGAERQEKEIKNADMTTETNDFDGYIATLRQITDDCGGYIEHYNAQLYDATPTKELKSGTIVLRIPFDQYESITAQLKALDRVSSFSESSHLETQQYYDTDARLQAKRVQEERLLEMLGRTTVVEDLIALEQRLSEVRESIELYEAQLRDIDSRASFSTVTVYVTEVAEAALQPVSSDFFTRLGDGVKRSVNGTVRFFEEVLILLAALSVPGMILAIPAVSILLWRKRKKAKKENNDL